MLEKSQSTKNDILRQSTYFHTSKVYLVFVKEYKIYIYKNIFGGRQLKVALDKVLIGARIRKIREELLEESRNDFAKRCNLTERHIGQIERGDFLLSLPTLSKITDAIKEA